MQPVREKLARWLVRVLAPRAAITNSRDLYELWFGRNTSTSSGAVVTPDTAMQLSAVWACVRVLSEDVAKLPLILYRRIPKGKERATDHWLYRLLHDSPNAWQTSFEFREMMQAHLLLGGNAFALLTVVRGEVREMLPVVPWRITVTQRADYTLAYELEKPDGSKLPVPADRILPLRGLSLDGLHGLSPVQYQREAIGLGLSLVQHGSRVFRNGAQVGGVLERPGPPLSKEAAERLRESFDEAYSGDNANKTLLLEEGMKYSKTAMSNESAQYLESRGYTRSDIASIFRVPPHKIGDLSRATFSNIEQMALEYLSDGLDPWLCRWEQRITASLISHIPEAQRGAYFAEFLRDSILRSDTVSRYGAYAVGVTNGFLSRNEVRIRENLNEEDGLDDFLVPLNMGDGSAPGAPMDDPPQNGNGARPAVAAALAHLG